LLEVLNVDVDALTGLVGVQCMAWLEIYFCSALLTSPGTNVIGNSCSANAACCTGNNYVSRNSRTSSDGILTWCLERTHCSWLHPDSAVVGPLSAPALWQKIFISGEARCLKWWIGQIILRSLRIAYA
jgi:hypothetical protein